MIAVAVPRHARYHSAVPPEDEIDSHAVEFMLIRISDTLEKAREGTLSGASLGQLDEDLDGFLGGLVEAIGTRLKTGGFKSAAEGWEQISGICGTMVAVLDLACGRIPEGDGKPGDLAERKDGYQELGSMAAAQALLQTSVDRASAGSLDEAEAAAAKAEKTFGELVSADPGYFFMLSAARWQRLQVTAQARTRRFKLRSAAAAYLEAKSHAEAAREAAGGREELAAQVQPMIVSSAASAERALMRAAILEGDYRQALTHVREVLASPGIPPVPGAVWAGAIDAFQRNVDEAYAPYISAEVLADEMQWDVALDELDDSERLWRRAVSAAFEIDIPQFGHIGESLQGFALQMMSSTRRRVDHERELQRQLTELRTENARLKAEITRPRDA